MIVGIVGSRDWPEEQLLRIADFVRKLAHKYPDAVVVSGGARGVDAEAERRAQAFGLDVVSYRPYGFRGMAGRFEYSIETTTHGERAQDLVVAKHRRISPPWFSSLAAAAHHRNGWIAEDSEQLVAFWDGVSRGTRSTIEKANGLTTHVFTPLRLDTGIAA